MYHVKGLDAERISREDQTFLLVIKKGKGVHSRDPAQAFYPPAGQRMQQDLSIRMASKSMAKPFQFRPNLLEVVNLPIKDDCIARPGVHHWLVACGREVNDGKPLLAKANRPVTNIRKPFAAVVRSAVQLRPAHFAE
jgi:hypothetical protein